MNTGDIFYNVGTDHKDNDDKDTTNYPDYCSKDDSDSSSKKNDASSIQCYGYSNGLGSDRSSRCTNTANKDYKDWGRKAKTSSKTV